MISVVLFMFLFGILEYGRYLFMLHLTTNAARDAARFAVVHTGGGTMAGEPATVSLADIQAVATTGMFNGQAYGTGMCGMQGNITGYTVEAYAIPDSSYYLTTPDLSPTGKPAWDTAQFQQRIAVRISGNYQPILPGFLGMSTSSPFSVIVVCGSEAN